MSHVITDTPILVGDIVRKGENAVYQHFHFFWQCLKKHSLLGSFKLVTIIVKG